MKKRFWILAAAMVLLLAACGEKSENVKGETEKTETSVVTEATTEETTTKVTATEETTTEVTETEVTGETVVTEKEPPKEFDIAGTSSVEDYFGGDVVYKADFDGDGEKESCLVRILGHGTQCYVEEIEITRANGEKIVVEHPQTATGMLSNLYKFEDRYEIYLHAGDEGYTDIVYPFDKLATKEENLINPHFGDIFDYSVIGDKLYFRGSLACGYSEVLGDIVYEYTYHGGSLKVSHIWYRDYIDGKDYDLGDVEPTDSLLVEPCKQDRNNVTLPEGDYLVESHAIMSNPQFLVYEEGLTYYVKRYASALSDEYMLSKYTLSLPEGYTDGVIISGAPGGGSGELGLAVHAKKGESDVVLRYLFYSDYPDKLKAPVYVNEESSVSFTPDEGSKLDEVYAHPDKYFCFVRMYVSTDDERVLYYIIDLSNGQRIRYDKIEDAHPAEAKALVTFADINFDGYEDLCLKLGNFGAQGFVSARAYLGEAEWEKYTLCESFEHISNPIIDTENKQILGTNRESAAERYYRKYEFKDGEFVKIAELLYNADAETVKIDGETYSVAEGSPDRSRFFGEESGWDIESTKWYGIVTE